MSRYIDADKLIERILKLKVVTDDMYGMGIARGIERAETAIQMQPTADVVEVVRCKDCKRCEIRKRVDGTYLFSCRSGCFKEVVSADHYCSYGERKER